MNKRLIKAILVIGMIVPTIKPQALLLEKAKCTETKAHQEWRMLPTEKRKKLMEPIKCQEIINATNKPKSSILSELPTSYNSDDTDNKDYVTSVKDQRYNKDSDNDSNLCWAFATVSTIETAYTRENGLSNKNSDVIDLSEEQLGQVVTHQYANGEINPDGFFYHQKDDGGNLFTHAGQTISARKALVTETTVKFGAELSRKNANAKPEYIANEVHYNIMGEFDTCSFDNLKEIKEAVVRYGSVSIGISPIFQTYFDPEAYNIFTNITNLDKLLEVAVKNNVFSRYEADKIMDSVGPSHAVTIVGYDDNYDKNNFNPSNEILEIIPDYIKPSRNGAFIVKDSYLDSGKDGYYYLSYESDILCALGFVTYSGIQKVDEDFNSYNDTSTGSFELLNLNTKTPVYFKKRIKLNSLEKIKDFTVLTIEKGDKIEIAYSPNSNADKMSEAIPLVETYASGFGWTTIALDETEINKLGAISGTGTLFLKYTGEYIPYGQSTQLYHINKPGVLGYISEDGINWESEYTDGYEKNKVYPTINMFTVNSNEDKTFEIENTYTTTDFSLENGGTFSIDISTHNMEATDILVQITSESGEDITDKFEINKSSNKIDIKLTQESPAEEVTIKFLYNERERTQTLRIPEKNSIKVTKITLSGTEEIAVGGEQKLTVKIEPKNEQIKN